MKEGLLRVLFAVLVLCLFGTAIVSHYIDHESEDVATDNDVHAHIHIHPSESLVMKLLGIFMVVVFTVMVFGVFAFIMTCVVMCITGCITVCCTTQRKKSTLKRA